jgi:hypothetical protein
LKDLIGNHLGSSGNRRTEEKHPLRDNIILAAKVKALDSIRKEILLASRWANGSFKPAAYIRSNWTEFSLCNAKLRG